MHFGGSGKALAVEAIAGLNKLDAVAEGVGSVETTHVGQRIIGNDGRSGGFERPPALGQVGDTESRMRFAGGDEILLNAQVNHYPLPFKPAAAPGHKCRRLSHLGQTEHFSVKATCLGFLSGGHSYLDMIERENLHQ